MATIEEFNKNMTIFYSKRTGDIKGASSGIQDMSVYGEDCTDYSLIFSYIVLPIDDYVIRNIKQFKINIDTKQLEMLPQVNQYPIASQ